MRNEGFRAEVGARHRDKSDHHVGTDQPGGGQDYTGRRMEDTRIRGVGQDTTGGGGVSGKPAGRGILEAERLLREET